MFFILERRENGSFNQLGIVVANTAYDAVMKLGAQVIRTVFPPESKVTWVELERRINRSSDEILGNADWSLQSCVGGRQMDSNRRDP